MTDYSTADFYTDASLVDDPHSYFRYLREIAPVTRLPYRNVVAVTGFEESLQVVLDTEHFSSANVVTGPIPELPFIPVGDDISAQLEAARHKMVFQEIAATADGERHANLRFVMAKLFTPRRMKAMEPNLHATANRIIDEFVARGHVDLVVEFAMPFAGLTISDLLGIPERGRQRFRALFAKESTGLTIGSTPETMKNNSLVKIAKSVFLYLLARRLAALPPIGGLRRLFARLGGRAGLQQDDVLTELALSRFPDGSRVGLADLTGIGAFMYGAGQDTTVRLMSSAFRLLALRPDLQDELRENPERIGDFIEEILRYDGAVKSINRLCIRTTTLAGMEIKAGTTVLVALLGANRDPRRFANPDGFDMDRPRLKDHLGFSRGAHTCIGAGLARAEMRTAIELLLVRLGQFRLSPEHHGRADAPRFEYEPTTSFHGLAHLHLEFDPPGAAT